MRKVIYIFFTIFLNTNIFSQPVSNFSVLQYDACAPVNITFINTSTGCDVNATNHWQAGTGDEAWNRDTVTFSYSVGGSYLVSLRVTSNGISDTKTITIVIYDPPVAKFNESLVKACIPHDVAFINQSLEGSAPISIFYWYFGDGYTSNEENPVHTYNTSGNYSVNLIVTDENLCSSQHTVSNMVSIANLPIINFVADFPQWCVAPHNVQFTPSVTTSFGLNYNLLWNFGDGTPNISGNEVNHTYMSLGNYDVSLTATDSYGCTSTHTLYDYIQLRNAVPEYSVSRSTICLGETVTFTNLTRYTSLWNFGGGVTSTNNPAYNRFMSYGNHPVTFTVNSGTVCEVSTTFNIMVEEVIANYTTNHTTLFSCVEPFYVEFINTSSENATSFYYEFESGRSSTFENCGYVFMIGSYRPKLTVTTVNGCTNTFAGLEIKVIHPQIHIKPNVSNGCAPLNVNFSYWHNNFPVDDVVNWAWNFGNGEVIENGSSSGITNYINPQTYTATLIVTDINDCEIRCDTNIFVGTEYHPMFEVVAENDTLCPLDIVYLEIIDNHDTCDFQCSTKYAWVSYGAEREGTISDASFLEPWQFRHDTGWVYLKLYTNHNGCISVTSWDSSLYILPPIIISFDDSTSCESPYMYKFWINQAGADIKDWKIIFEDFEDDILYEELNSTRDTIEFVFPNRGSYNVKVNTYNNRTDCEFYESMIVIIDPPEAIIEVAEKTCVYDSVSFNGNNSLGANAFKWNFGDGTILDWRSSNRIIKHKYSEMGTYTVILYVSNNKGCIDSTFVDIVIVDIDISILADNAQGCNNIETVFTDMSNSNDDIIYWEWRFHDGIDYGSTVTHTYSEIGEFHVDLFVKTRNECVALKTFWNLVQVSTVDVDFDLDSRISCFGTPILFESQNLGENYTYTWDFGDGNIIETNENIISYAHQSAGVFDVKLTIENGRGCAKDYLIEDCVTIEKLSVSFNPNEGLFYCYPVELELNPVVFVEPEWTEVEYLWDMGNGDNLAVFNPEYLYVRPGTFDINFTVRTNKCVDLDTHTIVIKGPYADVHISDNSICKGDEVFFRMYNIQGVDSLTWVVGGGISFGEESFSYTYNEIPESGFFTVSLFISDDTCGVYILNNIYVYDVVAGFDVLDLSQNELVGVCSPIDAILEDRSRNADFKKWYIDGNLFGNGLSSEHLYIENLDLEDKLINISLEIESIHGCKDNISKDLEIFALPILNVSQDTLICIGDEIVLKASGGNICEWSPDKYISDIYSYNPLVAPIENIIYNVIVKNEKECYKRDSVIVKVQQEPEVYFNTPDTTIIVGEIINVSLATNQTNMSYNWSPNYMTSCINCPEPILQPLSSTTYFVLVEDSSHCFRKEYLLNIIVNELYALDVPMSFTPQSSNENSIVFVKGYGIKELKQFRIYNRWGEEMFFSNDMSKGWDGYFKGKLQNMDNYSYFVEAEMYNGITKIKKGHIMLIR